MATAYALARHSNTVRLEEITRHFPDDLREFAAQATLFKPELMSIEDAKANEGEAGSHLNQTILITPGRRNRPQSFLMGSSDTDPDAQDKKILRPRLRWAKTLRSDAIKSPSLDST